jgi:hypothetical protein
MQTKRSFFTIFMIALAALALVFATAAPSDAGWYKKAKKAAKKAGKKISNIEKEVRTGAIGQAVEKAKGDVRREGFRVVGDATMESRRFIGDVTREGGKFGGDISKEAKKFRDDTIKQSKRMGSYDLGGGARRLWTNIEGGGQQLGYNLYRGERNLTHNIDRGVDNFNKNVFGLDSYGGSFGFKLAGLTTFGIVFGNPLTYPFAAVVFKDQLRTGLFGDGLGKVGAFDRLGRELGEGSNRVGDAFRDERDRVRDRVFGSPKVTDLNKSDKDEESPTGKVANALTEKKRKAIDAPESSDTPVAIFRAETDTGIGDSTGGSDTISRERTTTSQGSSTGSSSESSGLGGSQTTGKKESTSTPSTGGSKVGGRPAGRR